MKPTPHQQRSMETFHTQNVQEQMVFQSLLVEKMLSILHKKTMLLTLRNVKSYLKAKEEGPGTVCKTTHFDN